MLASGTPSRCSETGRDSRLPVVVSCSGGPRAAVPGVLRVDQPVELTAVEEDPAALRALVDVDAVALVGAHGPVALRTGQLHARGNGGRTAGGSPRPSAQWAPHIGCGPRWTGDTGHPAARPQGAPEHGQGRRLRARGRRRHPGRRHARRRRVRAVRRPDRADRRAAGAGRQRAHHDLEQLRRRRPGAGRPALRRPDQPARSARSSAATRSSRGCTSPASWRWS